MDINIHNTTNPTQSQSLNQPTADLDITCIPSTNTLTLHETIGHSRAKTRYSINLTPKNTRFINLQGQEDKSLVLTLQTLPEARGLRGNGLRLQTRVEGFRASCDHRESRLYTRLYRCEWEGICLKLRLPACQVDGWKTVGMLLLTFGQVGEKCWEVMVDMRSPPSVAGLDWRGLERMANGKVEKRNGVVVCAEKIIEDQDDGIYL